MGERLTLLRHPTNLLAKTWRADGTIGDYDDAKFYTLEEVEVSGLVELSALLVKLEREPRVCLIRGRYVGDDLARQRDPEFKPGRVRRTLDYFDDQPLHTVLVDVDKFESTLFDANAQPELAVEEFIHSQLPAEFRVAGYHWQMSNSAGHPSKGSELRAHLWFWLAEPYTSAQLAAWAKATAFKGDPSLLRRVQVHYTAGPVFEQGQVDPFERRHGLVDGLLGDEVPLDVGTVALAAVEGGGRATRMLQGLQADTVAQALDAAGLVRSLRGDGGLNVVCPFVDEHGSGEGAESSTIYYPANTGGYAKSNFKCLHAACVGRTRGLFLARLGVDEVRDEFEVLAAPAEPGQDSTPAVRRKGVPEAQHLTTDQANAGRIVSKFGKHLIVMAGQWFAWSGTRWEKDDGEVYRYACTLSKIIHAEADGWAAKKGASAEETEKYPAIAEALRKWAQKSEMKNAIEAAVGLAKKMMAVSDDALDSSPWLLNCLNGTVDLRTGAIKAHDPADYITKLVPLAYDPTARSAAWETVVARVTLEEGVSTRPLARFLQRWFGYCATGSTREQCFVVHYGNGSNGKSTILDTVAQVMGDYAATAAPGLLVGRKTDEHPTGVADIFGRRMVTAHETGEGGALKEEVVKQLTGGDKVKARFMRGDFFEFDPTHKLQLLTNHKPQIRGQDNGIWRRVLLMPYMARFAVVEEVVAGRAHYVKDTRIAERLRDEVQGVLTWIVEGAKAWASEGLQPPDVVLAASKDYQTEQDRIGQFVSECCELDPQACEPLSDDMGGLYPAYRGWCNEGGWIPMSKLRFAQELERCVPNFAKKATRSGSRGERRREVLQIHGLRLLASH